MSHLHRFPLHATDWLADEHVCRMSPVERSIYLDLLLRSWVEGSIPAPPATETWHPPEGYRATPGPVPGRGDRGEIGARSGRDRGGASPEIGANGASAPIFGGRNEHDRQWARLAEMARVDVRTMKRAWRTLAPRFVAAGPGRLVHPRLERERANAMERVQAAKAKAHTAALARWSGRRPGGDGRQRPASDWRRMFDRGGPAQGGRADVGSSPPSSTDPQSGPGGVRW